MPKSLRKTGADIGGGLTGSVAVFTAISSGVGNDEVAIALLTSSVNVVSLATAIFRHAA